MSEPNNIKLQTHVPPSLKQALEKWMARQGIKKTSDGIRIALGIALEKEAQVTPEEEELVRLYRMFDSADRYLTLGAARSFSQKAKYGQ